MTRDEILFNVKASYVNICNAHGPMNKQLRMDIYEQDKASAEYETTLWYIADYLMYMLNHPDATGDEVVTAITKLYDETDIHYRTRLKLDKAREAGATPKELQTLWIQCGAPSEV